MRYLMPVTLAVFVGLTACSDVNQPVIGNDPFVRSGTGLDPQMGALFEKVWRSVPVRGDSEIIVGVLALDRTAGSALVAFENRGGADVYEYVLLEDGWTKGRFVEHRPATASSLNGSDSPAFMDWGGPVAYLYGLNDVAIAAMWSPAPWAGYYEARFHTDQGNVFRGKCLAGTQQYPEGPTTLRCLGWMFSRTSYPANSYGCGLPDCRFVFYDPNDATYTKKYGAEGAVLQFMIQTPVHATIGGPPQPIRLVGAYTWTAYPTGGDGSHYSYSWYYSTDNVNWAEVGSERTYTRSLSRDDPDLYVKVIVTGVGSTTVVTEFVDLTQPLQDQLGVTIQGPYYIDTDGQYTWTAATTGGIPPFSYGWEISYQNFGGYWSPVGSSDSTLTQTVYTSNGPFDLRVTVTSSDGFQSAVASLHVGVPPPPPGSCGTQIICDP